MSSSESSGVYDDHDPMELVSDYEYGPVAEVLTLDKDSDPEEDLDFISNDDDMDDFQPLALPVLAINDVPLEDDVLALSPQLHDIVIVGHPEGEHLVEVIPFPAIPLAAIQHDDWPFVIDLHDDNDVVPVFHVDHLDVAILHVVSPVVYVVDISYDSDSRESVTSSALRTVGLEAHPADDASSAVCDTRPI
ncbi:hypothetical protein HanXRQr2_Chr17g0810321 [Helianthus annuus]|uniref:Uncharacterized protein n=1 Tax=Helianthus annuus TaxID=4232 RepID=A0A9K3GUC5_HELAN|nr:hypothetical protein HanXRQr2_Chr17g0810321 [Helianthus annuus]